VKKLLRDIWEENFSQKASVSNHQLFDQASLFGAT